MMSLKLKEEQREEGFTLIELLVVVIIIGILAAIAIPVFLNQRESAWRSAVESDLRNAAVQFETVYTREGEYPAEPSAAVDSDASPYDLLDSDSADTGVDLTVSDGVTLDWTLGTGTYTITGNHADLTESMTYESETGGLGEWSGS